MPAAAIGVSGAPAMNATANTIAAEHDGRAEVALRQAQPAADDAAAIITGTACAHGSAISVSALGQQVGAVQQHRQLQELRRLEVKWAEAHPRLGLVDPVAEAGDERQQHQPARDQQERRRPGAARSGTARACAIHSPTRPSTAHSSCLLKMRHGELPWWNWLIDDADNTITRPSITKTAITTAIT